MNRFNKHYVSSVLNEVGQVMSKSFCDNKAKEMEIKSVLRKFYFFNQKALKQTQEENCEYSIFDYYCVQNSLVQKFQTFSSLELNDWEKLLSEEISIKELTTK